MFMGHYGPAVFDTQRGHGVPLVTLWQGFLAVQAIDIVFAVLTLFGIEGSGHMVDGEPLFHIPWSHSLVTSVLVALICGGLFRFFKPKAGRKGFWIIAGLVFSHWVLDVIVHRPDLPLFPGSSFAFGLGGWNYPLLAYVLEMGLLLAGFLYWRRVTISKSMRYAIALWALFLFMGMLQFVFILLPGLQVQAGTFDMEAGLSGPALGAALLAIILLLAGLIGWIETGRPSRFAPREVEQGDAD